MKRLLFFILLSINLYAIEFKVGDTFGNTTYKDQFDKPHTIDDKVQTLIIAFTRDTGNVVKDVLSTTNREELSKTNVLYLADISGMPSFVSDFFAVPKMKKYSFDVLLERQNDLKKVYPYSEEKITVIKLNNSKIEAIKYISTQEELKKEIE